MRLLHISDTHGRFLPLNATSKLFDAVVHSGDFAPNFKYGAHEGEIQLNWVRNKIYEIKSWLQGRSLLFTLGNHDFMDPWILERLLNDSGIEAFCLHDKIVSYKNVNFYGFPYVPIINGKYAYESGDHQMAQHLNRMIDALNQTYVDVIVAHCPPHNCLDLARSNRRFGSTVIANYLDYKLSREMEPAYYLCGHIHESNGMTMRHNMLISNAATVQHILEL